MIRKPQHASCVEENNALNVIIFVLLNLLVPDADNVTRPLKEMMKAICFMSINVTVISVESVWLRLVGKMISSY